ncbi:MAG TPA: electron transport complex subunit RsxC [Alcanivorax sp.]|nr:electron transport complex subunit RsxC [Alcanivorax sp.]HAR59247.1 electron transport complex subunit RsxC [Alcanivorax sp.]HAV69933.1 electron transport complex subunit RsxC [Alcanivorax sp.]HBY49668.1 electron transport complex subunit RsxC [Alcanivorax sp.]HCI11840.1 electron transport complex subunit RsxC [Alcanivorax sp.]
MSLFQRLLPGARRAPVYDFPGGVHPAEHKTVSNRTPIAPGPRPAQLVLPLNMHLGAPARPIVAVGDRVLKGQMLAEPAGAVSAALHAPTSGTVVALGPRPIQHPSGMDALCIVLEPDGEDRWAERRPVADHTRLGPGKLIALLRDAGVAGLGGAGFPTSVKVNLGDHQRVEQLIINAVECEPYITADDRLMRERADEIVLGIQILQYLLNPHDTLIGIEDNKPEAIAALRAACADSDVEVRVVPTKYPSGGEKQLIQLLTGKEVPSGSIPAQCGVVCQNVGTAWAVKRAVHDGEPLLSRITTVTGDAVARPGNYEVWLGTPVADLLHHAGVDKERLGRLVMGGPMMGFTLHDPSVPVVKTSNCVIAASAEELPEPPPEQACIRCGACAEVCPANLLPQQLYWYAKTDDFERAQHHNLMDCIECGACAYVCPSHIPLVQYYRYAKGEIRTQAAEQIKADRARERFEARQARLEREQAEKEARRRARLEANRKKQEAATDSGAGDEKLAALKKEVGQASSAYKAAVKAAKTAEAQEADNAAELRARADSLKAEADRAKAALRDAKAAAPAPAAAPAESTALADLKKAVGEASSAYKAAVKAAKTAEAEEADDAAELRARADTLKAEADRLKAELRDAKAAQGPAAAPAAPAPSTQDKDTAAEKPAAAGAAPKAAGDDQAAAKRQKRLKALKTAYNMAHKQYKEAHAAVERAERAGQESDEALAAMHAKVEKLKAKADHCRDALDALVEQAKADILAHTGKDLKTLKLDAARAESALRDKADELERRRDTSDADTLETLNSELDALQEHAQLTRLALKTAVEEQGLVEE